MRWAEGTTEAQIEAVIEAVATLPSIIPEIVHFRFGRDAKVNEGNFDFAVVADFADADGYRVYRDDPAHRAMIDEKIKPILAERAAIQMSL
jgi:hypothetical protein